ncbi:MAG: hypothetical protein FWE82_09565 [Defluviitaleaceae bacterium]|nr:hypothetical protein [Defluviitaleaceae bacterium]
MTPKERVKAALRLEKPDRTPFMEWWFDNEIGKGILGKENYTREEIAEAMCMDGIGTYHGTDAYTEKLISSSGREFEGRGLLTDRSCLNMIKLPNPHDPSLYDNIKRKVEQVGERFFIFTGMSTGIDYLMRGMGLDNFSYALYDDIKLIEDILDIYSDWAAESALEISKTGVDAIWCPDDFAFTTSLMFSTEIFREIMKPRMKKVIGNTHLPKLFHCDGNIEPVIGDLIEIGFNGLHPIDPTAMDIEKIKNKWGDKICLVGNIDLSYTLVRGTPDEVKAEVTERIKKIGYNGGYILSSANSITEYCPTENILAMRDALIS